MSPRPAARARSSARARATWPRATPSSGSSPPPGPSSTRAPSTPGWRGRSPSSRRTAPHPEAAEQEQRRLPQPAPGGQETELHRGVVEIEEAPCPPNEPVGELQVVKTVERHEPVGGGQHGGVALVGPRRPPGGAHGVPPPTR